MKSLNELNGLLSNLPSPFARDAVSGDFPLSRETTPAVNYETGIPSKYAASTGEGGALMPRADFNRLGALASNELFFRRAGGIHTFSAEVADRNAGYCKGAVLWLNDEEKGVFKAVESTEAGNDLDFAANPETVDAEVTKPSDEASAPRRVLWKSAGRLYGLEEGLVHFGVDFSRRQDIPSGDSVAEDSLVLIGSNAWGFGVYDTEANMKAVAWSVAIIWAIFEGSGTSGYEERYAELLNDFTRMRRTSECGDFAVELKVGSSETMRFNCKGMQGGSVGFDSVSTALFSYLINPNGRQYYNRLMGGASFPLAFFAKRGTRIDYKAYANTDFSAQGNELADAVTCIAYPIGVSVDEDEEGGAS